MQLYYCDTCGKLIPPPDVEAQKVVWVEEGHAHCLACVPAGTLPKPKGITSSTVIKRAETPGLGVESTLTRKTPSSRLMTALNEQGEMRREAPRRHVPPPPDIAPSKKTPYALYIGAGVGMAVLLVVLLVILLSPPKPKEKVASNDPAPPPRQPTTQISVTPTTPSNETPPSTTEQAVPKPLDTGAPAGYDPRAEFATSLLEQAKKFQQDNAGDFLGIREKFQLVVDKYGSTPAGQTALKTIAEMKLPEQQLLPKGQSKARLNGEFDIYLSVGDALRTKSFNNSAKDNASTHGKALETNNRTFSKGIGIHAPGELVYDLGGKYRWISGYVGILKERKNSGSIELSIWGDENKIFESPVVKGGQNALYFSVAVKEVRLLRIVVGDARDGNANDSTILGELKLWTGFTQPTEGDVATAPPPPTQPDKPLSGGIVTNPSPVNPVPANPVPIKNEAATPAQYAALLGEYQEQLAQNNWSGAKTKNEAAQKDSKFSKYSDTLKQDAELGALVELAESSVPKGAALLADGREFTLIQLDGQKLEQGPGKKTKILKFENDGFHIEQDVGGGKMQLTVALNKFDVPTLEKLSKLALPPGGQGKLASLTQRFINGLKKPENVAHIRDFIERSEKAVKGDVLPEPISRLKEWLNLNEKEYTAESALAELEKKLEKATYKEVEPLRDALKQWSGASEDTSFADHNKARVEAFNEKLGKLDLRPGLWASYFTGDGNGYFKNYLFSRAEKNMDGAWGGVEADKRVPNDWFGKRIGGILRVTKPGKYNIQMNADDGITVSFDGKSVSTGQKEKKFDVELTAGDHPFKVEFTQATGKFWLNLSWVPPGEKEQKIPAECFWYVPTQMDAYQAGQ